ncbi:hypothetical protein KAI04_05230 [Candidatus Pacearchaeota archaeon]|nr:hypothetical protein [Candidatus Pacearchaeota archaeon]
MVKKIYNYLEEKKILVDAPKKYSLRIGKNFEEPSTLGNDADLTVKIKGLSPTTIVKDRNYPFARTSFDDSRDSSAIDFFRYKNKTQTILMPSENEFIIESYLLGDESGATRIIKKWYFNQDSAKNKALFHSSLVSVGLEGILIPGISRSGKTSLTLSFLENVSANFIAEEDTLIQKNGNELTGFYLPKPIHIRVKLIYESEKLSEITKDLSIVEATQTVDEDYLERLFKSRTSHLDANVDIARKTFANLLGVRTKSKHKITRIILPECSSNKKTQVKKLSADQAYSILKETEILKNSDIGRLKKAYQVEPLPNPLMKRDWIEGISCFKLSFSDYKDLNKTIIEDLLS